MTPANNISLAQQVKKTITNRIIICFSVLFLMAFLFAIYDLVNSFSILNKSIETESLNLKNFIISQALIENEAGIQTQLDQLNKRNGGIQYQFVPDQVVAGARTIHWVSLWKWDYYFPIVSMDNTNIGYLKAGGSFSSDKELFYQFLLLITIFIMFSAALFFLLYPLAYKIPRLLFITPINDLLALLKNKENRTGVYKHPSSFLEINEISKEIFSLFHEVQEKTREAAIGQVAAQVAHDIRSPLAALQAFTEQQLTEIEESKRILLRNAVYQIRDIVNNLDQDTFHKEKNIVQVAILLEYVLSERRAALLDKQVTIKQYGDIDTYGFFVNVSSSEIIRVLTNIINNAIESIVLEEGVVDVRLYAEDNNIVISISDNGVGIPQGVIGSLFQRGFTTKKTGSGLGLFYAKKTITEWGGSIGLSSTLAQGTTIYIKLPAQPAPPWFVSQLSIPDTSVVICVDDSISIWNAWQERFKRINQQIELRYCKNKAELLRELGREERLPCLYLVDYEFSCQDYTGLDLIEKILVYKKPEDQVFLVTSRSDEALQQFCLEHHISMISKFFALKIPIKLDSREV